VLGAVAWYVLFGGTIWALLAAGLVTLVLIRLVDMLTLTLGPPLWQRAMLGRRVLSVVKLLAVAGLAALLVAVIGILADSLYGRRRPSVVCPSSCHPPPGRSPCACSTWCRMA
jgi:hypothetical protein